MAPMRKKSGTCKFHDASRRPAVTLRAGSVDAAATDATTTAISTTAVRHRHHHWAMQTFMVRLLYDTTDVT